MSNPLVDLDHWWRPMLLWPVIAYAAVRLRAAWRTKARWLGGVNPLPRYQRPTPD